MARCAAAWVGIDLERMELGRQFQPGTIIDPICDLNKRIVQKILIHVLIIRDRKVEIFRKPVVLRQRVHGNSLYPSSNDATSVAVPPTERAVISLHISRTAYKMRG